MVIYYLEFRVLKDQIIAELYGNYFVETISLDDDKPILAILDCARGDIGDINESIRVFKRKTLIGCDYFSIF